MTWKIEARRKQGVASRKSYQKFYGKRVAFFRGMAPIWKAALMPEGTQHTYGRARVGVGTGCRYRFVSRRGSHE